MRPLEQAWLSRAAFAGVATQRKEVLLHRQLVLQRHQLTIGMPERLALVLEPQEMQVEVALRKKLVEQTHFRSTLSQTNFPVELQVQNSPLEAPTTPLRVEQSVQVPEEVRKEVVAQVQAARLRFQAVPALQLHLMPSELLLEPGRVEQAVQTPLSEYWVREQRHLNFLASQVKPVLQSHLPSVEVFLAPGMAEQEEQDSLARRQVPLLHWQAKLLQKQSATQLQATELEVLVDLGTPLQLLQAPAALMQSPVLQAHFLRTGSQRVGVLQMQLKPSVCWLERVPEMEAQAAQEEALWRQKLLLQMQLRVKSFQRKLAVELQSHRLLVEVPRMPEPVQSWQLSFTFMKNLGLQTQLLLAALHSKFLVELQSQATPFEAPEVTVPSKVLHLLQPLVSGKKVGWHLQASRLLFQVMLVLQVQDFPLPPAFAVVPGSLLQSSQVLLLPVSLQQKSGWQMQERVASSQMKPGRVQSHCSSLAVVVPGLPVMPLQEAQAPFLARQVLAAQRQALVVASQLQPALQAHLASVEEAGVAELGTSLQLAQIFSSAQVPLPQRQSLKVLLHAQPPALLQTQVPGLVGVPSGTRTFVRTEQLRQPLDFRSKNVPILQRHLKSPQSLSGSHLQETPSLMLERAPCREEQGLQLPLAAMQEVSLQTQRFAEELHSNSREALQRHLPSTDDPLATAPGRLLQGLQRPASRQWPKLHWHLKAVSFQAKRAAVLQGHLLMMGGAVGLKPGRALQSRQEPLLRQQPLMHTHRSCAAFQTKNWVGSHSQTRPSEVEGTRMPTRVLQLAQVLLLRKNPLLQPQPRERLLHTKLRVALHLHSPAGILSVALGVMAPGRLEQAAQAEAAVRQQLAMQMQVCVAESHLKLVLQLQTVDEEEELVAPGMEAQLWQRPVRSTMNPDLQEQERVELFQAQLRETSQLQPRLVEEASPAIPESSLQGEQLPALRQQPLAQMQLPLKDCSLLAAVQAHSPVRMPPQLTQVVPDLQQPALQTQLLLEVLHSKKRVVLQRHSPLEALPLAAPPTIPVQAAQLLFAARQSVELQTHFMDSFFQTNFLPASHLHWLSCEETGDASPTSPAQAMQSPSSFWYSPLLQQHVPFDAVNPARHLQVFVAESQKNLFSSRQRHWLLASVETPQPSAEELGHSEQVLLAEKKQLGLQMQEAVTGSHAQFLDSSQAHFPSGRGSEMQPGPTGQSLQERSKVAKKPCTQLHSKMLEFHLYLLFWSQVQMPSSEMSARQPAVSFPGQAAQADPSKKSPVVHSQDSRVEFQAYLLSVSHLQVESVVFSGRQPGVEGQGWQTAPLRKNYTQHWQVLLSGFQTKLLPTSHLHWPSSLVSLRQPMPLGQRMQGAEMLRDQRKVLALQTQLQREGLQMKLMLVEQVQMPSMSVSLMKLMLVSQAEQLPSTLKKKPTSQVQTFSEGLHMKLFAVSHPQDSSSSVSLLQPVPFLHATHLFPSRQQQNSQTHRVPLSLQRKWLLKSQVQEPSLLVSARAPGPVGQAVQFTELKYFPASQVQMKRSGFQTKPGEELQSQEPSAVVSLAQAAPEAQEVQLVPLRKKVGAHWQVSCTGFQAKLASAWQAQALSALVSLLKPFLLTLQGEQEIPSQKYPFSQKQRPIVPFQTQKPGVEHVQLPSTVRSYTVPVSGQLRQLLFRPQKPASHTQASNSVDQTNFLAASHLQISLSLPPEQPLPVGQSVQPLLEDKNWVLVQGVVWRRRGVCRFSNSTPSTGRQCFSALLQWQPSSQSHSLGTSPFCSVLVSRREEQGRQRVWASQWAGGHWRACPSTTRDSSSQAAAVGEASILKQQLQIDSAATIYRCPPPLFPLSLLLQ